MELGCQPYDSPFLRIVMRYKPVNLDMFSLPMEANMSPSSNSDTQFHQHKATHGYSH